MFNQYIEKLKELHEKNSLYVETSLSSFVYQLEKNLEKEKAKSEDKPTFLSKFGIYENEDIIYITFLIIIFLLYGFLVNANLFMYVFGFVFFIAGYFVGQQKLFGLIFLFSHGGTGLGLMIYTLLVERFQIGNFAFYTKLYLCFVFLVFICAIVGMVFYNLSDSLKENKYNKVYLLGLFLLGVILVGLLPNLPF